MSPLFVFPDTNFFLHFKHPADAPWAELGECSDVRVVVSRTIQEEIDKKKHELSGKPKARAREMAAILTASLLGERTHVFKQANPRVVLEHYERPGSFQAPDGLSINRWNDDAFVADVLAFMEGRHGEWVVLISNDGGALMTAKRFGVPLYHVHGPKWELPPEADPRDKELAELRRINAELSRTGPSIQANFANVGKSGRVETTTIACRALDEAERELLVGELMARHPRQDRFDVPPGNQEPSGSSPPLPADVGHVEWTAPTDYAIKSYLTAYDLWLDQARTVLGSLPNALEVAQPRVSFTLTVENVGVEPGINVMVGFRTTPGLLLRFPPYDEQVDAVAVTADDRPLPTLRPPPSRPSWRKVVKAAPARTPTDNQSTTPGRAGTLTSVNLADLVGQHGHLLGPFGHSATAQAMAAAGMLGPTHLSEMARIASASSVIDKALFGTLGQASSLMTGLDRFNSLNPEAYAVAEPVVPAMLSNFSFRLPDPRDPYTFYFVEGGRERDLDYVSFECAEFRHRGEPKEFQFEVFFAEGAVQGGGEVTVEVHARNLRAPVTCKVAVIRKVTNRDVMSDARVALGLMAPGVGMQASGPQAPSI